MKQTSNVMANYVTDGMMHLIIQSIWRKTEKTVFKIYICSAEISLAVNKYYVRFIYVPHSHILCRLYVNSETLAYIS